MKRHSRESSLAGKVAAAIALNAINQQVQVRPQREVMVRRNSRSESRSGNNSVVYQNLSAANGQQL